MTQHRFIPAHTILGGLLDRITSDDLQTSREYARTAMELCNSIPSQYRPILVTKAGQALERVKGNTSKITRHTRKFLEVFIDGVNKTESEKAAAKNGTEAKDTSGDSFGLT